MSDLIKGFIYVKDPLSLFAFLALILLAAFRTKKVPELFFGLLKKTIDGPTIEKLTRRFMAYAFAAFVVVCACAVTGQVLAHATSTHPYSADDAQREIGSSSASDEQKQAALRAYADGLEQERNHKLDEAIQSLQQSVAQVPSLSAEYTLALLYDQKHDGANASKHAEEAVRLVKPGDTLAQVRVQRLADAVRVEGENPPPRDCQFVGGRKTPFSPGGSDIDHAERISPGLYILGESAAANRYYKLRLRANQTLQIDFRNPDIVSWSGATIYDAQGANMAGNTIGGPSSMTSIKWISPANDWSYFSVAVGTTQGAVFCVAVKD